MKNIFILILLFYAFPLFADNVGQTSRGTSKTTWDMNYHYVNISVPSAGTATGIYCWVGNDHAENTHNAKCALYNSSRSLLAGSGSVEIATDVGVGTLYYFDIADTSVSAATYYLAYQGDNSDDEYWFYDTSQTGYTHYYDTQATYAAFPATIANDGSDADRRMSIYLVYTPSGGGAPVPTIHSQILILGSAKNSNPILIANNSEILIAGTTYEKTISYFSINVF